MSPIAVSTDEGRTVSRVRHADTTAAPYLIYFGSWTDVVVSETGEDADDARWKQVIAQADRGKVESYVASIRARIANGEAESFRFSDL